MASARSSVYAQQRSCVRSSVRELVLVRARQVFKGPRLRHGFGVATWLRLGSVGPRSRHQFCVATRAGFRLDDLRFWGRRWLGRNRCRDMEFDVATWMAVWGGRDLASGVVTWKSHGGQK